METPSANFIHLLDLISMSDLISPCLSWTILILQYSFVIPLFIVCHNYHNDLILHVFIVAYSVTWMVYMKHSINNAHKEIQYTYHKQSTCVWNADVWKEIINSLWWKTDKKLQQWLTERTGCLGKKTGRFNVDNTMNTKHSTAKNNTTQQNSNTTPRRTTQHNVITRIQHDKRWHNYKCVHYGAINTTWGWLFKGGLAWVKI
jgi:hypothetical protein